MSFFCVRDIKYVCLFEQNEAVRITGYLLFTRVVKNVGGKDEILFPQVYTKEFSLLELY